MSTGTMYVANTAKLVAIERLRLDRNFSAKANDWSTWKAHTNIAVATGSSDRRGTKRKANAADEAYEALSSIPTERVALNVYLAKMTTKELVVLIKKIATARVTEDLRISQCWAAIQLRMYIPWTVTSRMAPPRMTTRNFCGQTS